MRIALVFPPQWDPRQPPLCLSALARCVASNENQVSTWDLNLALYRSLFSTGCRKGKLRTIMRSYSDPQILNNSVDYSNATKELEEMLVHSYDPEGPGALFWDNLSDTHSPDKAKDWRHAVQRPSVFPWYRRLSSRFDAIIRWGPDLIGVTANSDTQVLAALAASSLLKAALPKARIILGGQAFRARRLLLSEQAWLFETVEAICISHGEPTLQALASGKSSNEVPNIFWHDGVRVVGPTCLESVGSIACDPVAQDPKAGSYLAPVKVIPLETARGCPWSVCSFCGHPGTELPQKARYVVRPMESVLAEIRRYMEMGHRHFFFVDEAIPNDRLRELSAYLCTMAEKIQWICYLRLEDRHDLETFRWAQRAGCKKVFFGLETGSDRLRKLHRKGSDSETAIRVLRDASRAGLAIHVFLLTGFPDETGRDRKDTEMALRMILPEADAFGFTYDAFPLAAEHCTPLHCHPERFGSAGIERSATADLSYRFSLRSQKKVSRITYSKARRNIKKIVDEELGSSLGLRHLALTNDSDHLLLLSAKVQAG